MMPADPTTPALSPPAPPSAALPVVIEKILVPTDFSGDAEKALRYAVTLARQFGAGIVLLHVFLTPNYPDTVITSRAIMEYQAEWQQAIRVQLNILCEHVSNLDGVNVQTVLLGGEAYERIVTAASDMKADLIVISTHGYTGLRRLSRMGSTAERIVRHAPCPVLVIREEERDFA